MLKFTLALAAVALGATAIAEPAMAQANEQFFPLLVYRTGPYAPNGIPWMVCTTTGTRSCQAAARTTMPAFELWVCTTSGFNRLNVALSRH